MVLHVQVLCAPTTRNFILVNTGCCPNLAIVVQGLPSGRPISHQSIIVNDKNGFIIISSDR